MSWMNGKDEYFYDKAENEYVLRPENDSRYYEIRLNVFYPRLKSEGMQLAFKYIRCGKEYRTDIDLTPDEAALILYGLPKAMKKREEELRGNLPS